MLEDSDETCDGITNEMVYSRFTHEVGQTGVSAQTREHVVMLPSPCCEATEQLEEVGRGGVWSTALVLGVVLAIANIVLWSIVLFDGR